MFCSFFKILVNPHDTRENPRVRIELYKHGFFEVSTNQRRKPKGYFIMHIIATD